ncbi:MAG: hypothetical protein RIM23_06420 [Coleofasciculus sp. G3-WIS-01]|uniref:hypothetical protein n=1 Tax=Coleofasciculus sp. G3-WIS-01 TaxID=3069528 RepID=UPI00330504BF
MNRNVLVLIVSIIIFIFTSTYIYKTFKVSRIILNFVKTEKLFDKNLLTYNKLKRLNIYSEQKKMNFHEDPDLMEEEILYQIPIGSPIDEAKVIMEQNGFKCEYVQNGTYSEVRASQNAPGRIRQTKHENVDFIYCDINQGFIVSRRWQAAIEYKDGCVTKVSVSTGLSGS